MNASRFTIQVVLIAMILTGVPARAQAQEEPNRPYRGLFGPATPLPQSLDLYVTAVGAYDDNVIAGSVGEVTDPRFQVRSFAAGGEVSLSYRRRSREGWNLAATGQGDLRYYDNAAWDQTRSYAGAISLQGPVGRRDRLSVSHVTLSSPYYLLGIPARLEGEAARDVRLTDPSLAIYTRQAFIHDTGATFQHQLTGRSNLSLMTHLRYTVFGTHNPRMRRDESAGILFTHRQGRYLATRFGYTARQANTGLTAAVPVQAHDIDVGFEFNRPLSFARRTRLTFQFGPAVAAMNHREGDKMRRLAFYRVVGHAALTHQMGRSWDTRLSYRRGWQFVEGFANPFFYDSVQGDIAGQLSRRARFEAGGQYGSDFGSGHSTYGGTIRLRFDLSRSVAVGVGYLYYFYRFPENIETPPGLAPAFHRQGLRVDLSFWKPLLR